jgi:hypothetical protein
MGYVRAFAHADIAQVADLHRRVFQTGAADARIEAAYRSYFETIVLGHPWQADGLPSLVHADDDGRITGFLGVMPRRMRLDGRPIRVAVSSQFIVEPGSRSQLAAIKLLKALAAAPHDLCLADEANLASRRIWEALGGSTAALYTLYWLRPLRPAACVARRLWQRGFPGAFRSLCGPAVRAVDTLLTRMPRSPFRVPAPSVSGSELDGEMLAGYLAETSRRFALCPSYEPATLDWLFAVLADKTGHGTFERVVVRGAGGDPVGWYLFYANPGGIGEVLQFGARDGAVGDVLDHLFHRAWTAGLVALSGRIEPRFIQDLADRECLFHHRGYWTLVRAERPGVLDAIHSGRAFLSRLEGEWAMRFQLDGQRLAAPAGAVPERVRRSA